MKDNSREIIELGNGYGFFCNVHDIENQYNIHDYGIRYIENRTYLEEMHPPTEDCDILCTVITIAIIFVLCLFVM
jgi:hypothetical protein